MINEKRLQASIERVFGKPLYDIKLEDAKVHISGGNSKLGKTIWNISTLCGNQDHLLVKNDGTLLTSIAGTCSTNCSGCFKLCYARKSAIQHHNVVIRAWGENTILKRNDIASFYIEVSRQIKVLGKKCKYFRWNQSGEIESSLDLDWINLIALNNPEVRFSLYTKNYAALSEFINNLNGHHLSIAKNLAINVSQWNCVADLFLSKYREYVNVFEYDDSNLRQDFYMSEEDQTIEALKKDNHCPAVRYDGKRNDITCDKCLRCYVKTGKVTKCYSH